MSEFLSRFHLRPLLLFGYLFLALSVVVIIWLYRRYKLLEEQSPEGIRRRARSLKNSDPIGAAEIYESVGDAEEAIRCYQSVQAWERAAALYAKTSRFGPAAESYLQAGEFERAAQLFQKIGEYGRAAETYLSARKPLQAAEAFEKGRRLKEAAELYEKGGQIERAAPLYEQAGVPLKAAKLFETLCAKEFPASGELSAEGQQRVAAWARRAGTLYLAAGAPDQAIEILTAVGLVGEAAEAAATSGDRKKAAALFIQAGLHDRAADLLRKGGDEKGANLALAESRRRSGQWREAATYFESAGAYEEAAGMYEQAGDRVQAANLYAKTGDEDRAADLFVAAGDFNSGASLLERVGRMREAGEVYLRGGNSSRASIVFEAAQDFYRAGLAAQKAGERKRAIALLQKIDRGSKDFTEAMLLLGRIYLETSRPDLAWEQVREISASGSRPDVVEVIYDVAAALEKEKEFSGALDLYEKVASANISYRDARVRADHLKKALTVVESAGLARTHRGPSFTTPSRSAPHPSGLSSTGGPAPPTTRYQLLQKVGQGGMGIVYRAEDTLLKRVVAYKLLAAGVGEDPALFERFLSEARLSASLNHRNIVTVYDAGREEDRVYITMEFIEGTTLKEQYRNPWTVGDLPGSISTMLAICAGLSYAHDRQVVHRDIKPTNIMVARDGAVKIMDFGLARVLSASAGERTSVKGTPLYMSPEQIIGRSVDQQSDIYSLGCTFYRMVAGEPPFAQGDVYYHHLNTPPVSPRQKNPQVPEALAAIVLRCIEKEKAKRYRRVDELALQIEQIRR